MYKILAACKEQLAKYTENIAQAITKGDWLAVAKYASLALTALLCILLLLLALALLLFSFVRRIFGPLFGAAVVFLMVLFLAPIIQMILRLYFEYTDGTDQGKIESAMLDEWADGIYGYVRDAVFLVLRTVSEYTNIITPSRASTIELTDEPYTIEDGYAVFNFMGKTCGQIEPDRLKKNIQYTFQQLHRAHELNGIPRDLTEINGSYYCPLQIFSTPQDLGDRVYIQVVFATEQTVKLTRARKLMDLDHALQARRKRSETSTDDPLFR